MDPFFLSQRAPQREAVLETPELISPRTAQTHHRAWSPACIEVGLNPRPWSGLWIALFSLL
jgi:hypothetical protein